MRNTENYGMNILEATDTMKPSTLNALNENTVTVDCELKKVNDALERKQEKLTAGKNISIDNNVISAEDSGGVTNYEELTNKPQIAGTTLEGNKTLEELGIQQELVAGSNVTITNGVISAKDTKYTAGDNIEIDENNVISATGGALYTAGNNIQISEENVISATDTTYTAGANVNISAQNVISATDTTYGDFVGTDGSTVGTSGLVPAPATTASGKYLKADGTWDTPENTTYTAGSNVSISAQNEISATDTKYTAGANVSISEENVISSTNTTYSAFTGTDGETAGTSGLVPAPSTTDSGKFLSANGSWGKPEGKTYTAGANINISQDGEISATDTTYSNFVGTDGTGNGTSGLVPAPTSSDVSKYLKSNGTWDTVSSGEMNVIESISVNGTAQTITNKNVDLSVPDITISTTDLTPRSVRTRRRYNLSCL